MIISTLLLLALTGLTLASPFPVLNLRAGAPDPIPLTNCTLRNPLPGKPDNYTASGLAPRHNATLYASYLALPDLATIDERWEQCLEQCHGLAGCKAAFMADEVPAPAGYMGGEGGESSRACLLYAHRLKRKGWMAVEGYTDATAANVRCDS